MRSAFLLLLVFSIASLILRGSKGPSIARRALLGLAAGILAAMLLGRMWIEVPVGMVAVRFDPFAGGIQERELGEGWHMVFPWQTASLFTVRTQEYSMTGLSDEAAGAVDDAMTCQTSEGLRLKIDVTVVFRISADGADRLWRGVGLDYVNTIVRPTTRNVVRLVVARYPIMEVYSNARTTPEDTTGSGILPFPGKRQEVEDSMFGQLKPRLEAKGITLERVLLRSVQYDAPDFEAAIVGKQVAQQSVVTQQYKLRIAQIQAQAQVERAKGTAEAIRMRGENLRQNQSVVNYEFVQKLPDDVEVRILPNGTMFLMSPQSSPKPGAQPAP